jgi:aconitate hydratase
VLSGNRNFEGRVNPDVQANYLASPPLVVAYASPARCRSTSPVEPIGSTRTARDVFLKDIWPTTKEINTFVKKFVTKKVFKKKYADVFKGDETGARSRPPGGETYRWNMSSTYVQNPPYFEGMKMQPEPIDRRVDARILAIFLDKITTDHISPAGSIKLTSPAGKYFIDTAGAPADFNQYGTRRGNHEVMMRGTFANIRIKNQMKCRATFEGGVTKHWPDGEQMPIYDAAMKYKQEKVPLVVFAGKEYGTGSSRDWAAKGTRSARRARGDRQSFERIHRSNLVGMGVLPLDLRRGDVMAVARTEGRRDRDDPRARRAISSRARR